MAADDFIELTDNFDFNSDCFSNIELDIESDFENRYIKPPKQKEIAYKNLKYRKATQLAKDINFQSLDRVFCIVSGQFIFGDFIEAFIVENKINCLELTISTLSLNQDNVDSLHNLIKADYIQKLNLIVSDYFYSHERRLLVPYIYEKLDIDNKFQFAAAGTHCKTYQFKTEGGKHIVMHGSVNLRSSSNIEQFVIEDNKQLYDFNQDYQNRILEKYKTINKSIRGNTLWQKVVEVQREVKKENQA